MIKYETTVTAVGEMMPEFAAEGILIFFGREAPEELHDFALLTTGGEMTEPVKPGDHVEIGPARFPVLGVGDVANQNIAQLGHLVLKFNGRSDVELPGDVSLPEGEAPQVAVGTKVRIVGGEG